MFMAKTNFQNGEQGLVGIIIVLVVIGLTAIGLYYYLSRQLSEAPKIIEEEMVKSGETVLPLEKELPKEEVVLEETVKKELAEKPIIQKCADGTLYGQCSINKPAYCENGILVQKCSLCGCSQKGVCLTGEDCLALSENVNCEYKNYKMAFILLTKNLKDATNERIDKLSRIKNDFSKHFSYATKNLANMDTSDNVYIMETDKSMAVSQAALPKKFYETHDDIYDFISIYTTFDTSLFQQQVTVVQIITGIGQALHDSSKTYGTKGFLKGINFMGNIDMYSYDYMSAAINGLLHETGHQWCCYVGDNFSRGQAGSELEIKQQDMHFYVGLQSPYEHDTPMGSLSWVPNNDGTFRRVKVKHVVGKYHPFQLYFMGLLPKEEYDTKFQIYDAGHNGNFDFEHAVPYKQISVNDIIKVEGERKCLKPQL